MQKDDFLRMLSSWAPAFGDINISVVGINSKESGKKYAISARIRVGKKDNFLKGFNFDGPIFWGSSIQLSDSPDGICKIINDALSDFVVPIFDGDKAYLLSKDDERFGASYDDGHQNWSSHGPDVYRVLRAVVTRGGYFRSIVSQEHGDIDIDWHLRGGEIPFNGLSDLMASQYVPSTNNGESMLEIIVDPPVRLAGQSFLMANKAMISLDMTQAANKDAVMLSYIARGDAASSVRGRRKLCDFSNSNNEKLSDQIDLEFENAQSLQGFIIYDGVITQHFWLHDFSNHTYHPRALYSAFDVGLEELSERVLNCKKPHAKTFEDAVSILFNLLGFSAIHYGGMPGLSEIAPDVVVASEENQVLIIECTIGLPDQGDQYAKVLQRTKVAERALKDAGWEDFRLHPVVATNFSESEILTSLDEAKEKGISVIYREKLQWLLDSLSTKVNTDYIFNEIVLLAQLNPFYGHRSRLGS